MLVKEEVRVKNWHGKKNERDEDIGESRFLLQVPVGEQEEEGYR